MDYWGRLGTSSELTLERPPLGLVTLSGINVVVMVELPQTNDSSVAQYIVSNPMWKISKSNWWGTNKRYSDSYRSGHGGIDGGTGVISDFYREHSVNLSVSEALKTELISRGINSFLVHQVITISHSHHEGYMLTTFKLTQ